MGLFQPVCNERVVILWSHANIITAELRNSLCWSEAVIEVAPYPFPFQQRSDHAHTVLFVIQ